MITENERWILSFYRMSEISGSLFFGRLAKSLKAGPIQHDMTKHYADEAMHAWYWTDCLERLGVEPLDLGTAYQDRILILDGLAPGTAIIDRGAGQVVEGEPVQTIR